MDTTELGKGPWLIFFLEEGGKPPTAVPAAEDTTRRVVPRGSTWGWLSRQLIGVARRLLPAGSRRLSTAPPRWIVDLFADVPEVYWIIQPVLLVRETPKATQSIRAIAARARTRRLEGGIYRVERVGMLDEV